MKKVGDSPGFVRSFVRSSTSLITSVFLPAAAAVATLTIMLEDGFLEKVQQRGNYLHKKLTELAGRFPALLTGARGAGLLRALVLSEKGIEHGAEIVNAMFTRGFLINFAGNVALRFAPPLIVSEQQIDSLAEELALVLEEIPT